MPSRGSIRDRVLRATLMRERYADFFYKYGDPSGKEERWKGWKFYHGKTSLGKEGEYQEMLEDKRTRQHIEKISNLHKDKE